ncbi:MAG: glutathione S-transferase N-terminal domain-containing protein [Leptospiraceae bacterium]|nr:glutathione S-transferase N-terminal domain-containing protein [Leptospiraceae bacterium]MDW8305895.1 glutathione S-transferase N-terminal domain-containing protein [Leptospiraceae bacterium]
MLELYGIFYSPWSEKARWALDYHRQIYHWHEYTPLVDSLQLMWKAKKWRVSVPILITPWEVIEGSLNIVRYGEKHGRKEKLLPFSHEEEILDIDALCDVAYRASRAIITARVEDNSEAQKALMPQFIPPSYHEFALPLAKVATLYLERKYSFGGVPLAQHKEVLRSVLQELRQKVRKNKTIFESFTLADISVALTLQFVSPVSDHFIPLSPPLREAFTQEDLAEEFSDLISWRNFIYENYRR